MAFCTSTSVFIIHLIYLKLHFSSLACKDKALISLTACSKMQKWEQRRKNNLLSPPANQLQFEQKQITAQAGCTVVVSLFGASPDLLSDNYKIKFNKKTLFSQNFSLRAAHLCFACWTQQFSGGCWCIGNKLGNYAAVISRSLDSGCMMLVVGKIFLTCVESTQSQHKAQVTSGMYTMQLDA